MQTDALNAQIIQKHCFPLFSGKIHIKETTESTNNDAKQLAKQPDSLYSVIIVNTQTQGRGRGSQTVFYSPKDTGIYLSLILPSEQKYPLTPALALAVCKTIDQYLPGKAAIKWVNDVLIEGKKVCGILCESVPETGTVIAGIGINFTTASFPQELAGTADAIFKHPPVSRNEFIGNLLTEIATILTRTDSWMPEYRNRSCVLGNPVRYRENNQWHNAIACDIDESGGLVIEENGTKKTLVAGEISLRLPATSQ